jgi:hypothetical protein
MRSKPPVSSMVDNNTLTRNIHERWDRINKGWLHDVRGIRTYRHQRSPLISESRLRAPARWASRSGAGGGRATPRILASRPPRPRGGGFRCCHRRRWRRHALAGRRAEPLPGRQSHITQWSIEQREVIYCPLGSRKNEPFWHISIDHPRDAGVLPLTRVRCGEFRWADMRQGFFIGFEHSLVAYVNSRNDLIVENIIEDAEWLKRVVQILEGLDVFFLMFIVQHDGDRKL